MHSKSMYVMLEGTLLILISCSFPLFEKCLHNDQAEAEELHEGEALYEDGELGEEVYDEEVTKHPMLPLISTVTGVAPGAQLKTLV
jgi:hypothetical protein